MVEYDTEKIDLLPDASYAGKLWGLGFDLTAIGLV